MKLIKSLTLTYSFINVCVRMLNFVKGKFSAVRLPLIMVYDYISEAGRRALCTKKHVQTLHRFCSHCPDEPEFDGLLARVCSVITLCLKHQALPVPATSPAMFNLNPILKGMQEIDIDFYYLSC